jgi:hypothetical protein
MEACDVVLEWGGGDGLEDCQTLRERSHGDNCHTVGNVPIRSLAGPLTPLCGQPLAMAGCRVVSVNVIDKYPNGRIDFRCGVEKVTSTRYAWNKGC